MTQSTKQRGCSCRALAGILPAEQLKTVLEKLSEKLVEALDISTKEAVDCVPAVMQALSSIGRLAPDVFAKHAASVADFVLQVGCWPKGTFQKSLSS